MKKHRSSENQDFEASEKANLLLLYKFFSIDEACYCLTKFSRNFFLLAPFTRIDQKCRFWAFFPHNSRSVILSVLIILKKSFRYTALLLENIGTKFRQKMLKLREQ